jgi:hypothetical protein
MRGCKGKMQIIYYQTIIPQNTIQKIYLFKYILNLLGLSRFLLALINIPLLF